MHRRKELANERLRLANEERKSLEKTVGTLQDKLTELNRVSDKTNELEKLEGEVERLTKEVSQCVCSSTIVRTTNPVCVCVCVCVCTRRLLSTQALFNYQSYSYCYYHDISILSSLQVRFQHAELVAKRAKVESAVKALNEQNHDLDRFLRSSTETLQKERDRLQTIKEVVPQPIEKLQRELDQQVDFEQLWSRLDKILESNAAIVVAEANTIRRDSKDLAKIHAGYCGHLGLNPGDNHHDGMDTGRTEYDTRQTTTDSMLQ